MDRSLEDNALSYTINILPSRKQIEDFSFSSPSLLYVFVSHGVTMPSSRQPHDPFTDAPLRPTTSNANTQLRSQTSQHSLRSNTSNTSGRPRQQRDLFAPSLSRRGTTPRFEDEVLADSDSEQDLTAQRQKQTRRIRHGSPDVKYGRVKGKQDEEQDFVNRKPDGSYLLGVAGFGETVAVPQMSLPKTEEEREQDGKGRRTTDTEMGQSNTL